MTARDEVARRCETIEQAYEFMLAYAAQGLRRDGGSQVGGQVRDHLSRAAAALTDLGAAYAAVVNGAVKDAAQGAGLEAAAYRAFVQVLDRDARSAKAAFDLVLAQPVISSQLVDNLNASIHVRTLLTDLFLIDEVLKTSSA